MTGTGSAWPAALALAVLGVPVGCAIRAVVTAVTAERSSINSTMVTRVSWPAPARAGGTLMSGLVTAAVFAAVTLRFGVDAQLPAYLFLAVLGSIVIQLDSWGRTLSQALVIPSYLISLLLLTPAGAAQAEWWPAARSAIGMLAFLGIALALLVGCPAQLGLDDVKLAGLVGLYLGWLSWTALLVGGCAGVLAVGVAGSTRAAGRSPGRWSLGYGSYLLAAAAVAVFGSVPLAAWYGSSLGAS